jgi:4-carboxymuconolactone decarboxylase
MIERGSTPRLARAQKADTDGVGVTTLSYYEHHHLPRFGDIAQGNDELAKKFFAWYGAVFKDGALTAREKSLIALAVAHAVQCPYCIDAYANDCLEKGSDLSEMTEAIHVAAAIRGGASLVHGVQMLEHVEKAGM